MGRGWLPLRKVARALGSECEDIAITLAAAASRVSLRVDSFSHARLWAAQKLYRN